MNSHNINRREQEKNMNAQQSKAWNYALSKWEKAENQPNPHIAKSDYNDSLAYFAIAAGSNEVPVLEVASQFCYDYCVFLAQNIKNYKDAEKVHKSGEQFANKALALDTNSFGARWFFVLSATDALGEKPSAGNTIFGGNGGWAEKLGRAVGEQGAYSSAKSKFLRSVAALVDAYAVKVREGIAIEDVIRMTEQLKTLVAVVDGHNIDFSEVYKAISAVDINILRYYSPDEELENLVNTLVELKDDAEAALFLLQQRR